jgi:hypothetical protein
MAMNINLTLVVQIIHFLGASFVIKRFLLRPGYEAIKADEDRLRQIRGLIAAQQSVIAQRQEHKRQRWTICQNYFSQNRPILEKEQPLFGPRKVLTALSTPSAEELEQLAQGMVPQLQKKVLNG